MKMDLVLRLAGAEGIGGTQTNGGARGSDWNYGSTAGSALNGGIGASSITPHIPPDQVAVDILEEEVEVIEIMLVVQEEEDQVFLIIHI